MFRNIKELHKTIGLTNYYYGKSIRKNKYKSLSKKYGFDKWHIAPYQTRQYAWDIVQMINADPETYQSLTVVEIGCGLGDIIRNINVKNKYGIDLSKEVIEAAKELDKNNTVSWSAGSFEDAAKFDDNIDLLITVNFMHEIEPEVLKGLYDSILSDKKVKYIIADSAKGYQYKYWHDFSYILPDYEVVSYETYCNNKRVFLFKRRED